VTIELRTEKKAGNPRTEKDCAVHVETLLAGMKA
jgi:hypothetical protein